MPWVKTADELPEEENQNQQVYNGLDCCITVEILQRRLPELKPPVNYVYNFMRALQQPSLEMTLRGIRLDETLIPEKTRIIQEEMERIKTIFTLCSEALWGEQILISSPTKILQAFQAMGHKIQSTDRDSLESFHPYLHEGFMARLILEYRDREKLLQALQARKIKDYRFHATFKVAGTKTGRWASSKDPYGRGSNLQNQTERVKDMYIADPGMKLAYIDGSQAESRAVAYLAPDEEYIQACEIGDVHTMVAKMVWPELDWTDDLKKDKKIAEQPYYRFFTYRDLAKRGQHGSNYYGKPATMAKHLHVEKEIMEDFQDRYFTAFSGIENWHDETIREIQVERMLITPVGRKRTFFGRPNDDSTIRSGIAQRPQSLVGDYINIGLFRIWWNFPQVQLLAQVHDAVLVQYPEDQEDEILPQLMKCMEPAIKIRDKTMIIPAEAECGWTWAHAPEHGMREYVGHDDRKRPREKDFLETVL